MDKIDVLSEISDVSMADEWYAVAGPDHFWIQWRFEVFKKHFDSMIPKNARILEIGCGNGQFRDQLETLGYTVDGCDLNMYSLNLANKGKGRLMYYNIYDLSTELLGSYDLIVLLDVIEHIDDDTAFIETAKKHLKPTGNLLINVPCYAHLFSKYDKQAGHVRRYSKKTLRLMAKNCGLVEEKLIMWGILLYPLAVLRKFYLRGVKMENVIKAGFKPPSKLMNTLLAKYSKFETVFGNKILPGSSILALFRKLSD
jgi:SAM-dependent methyltransferase